MFRFSLCNIKNTLVKKNTVYVKTFCHQDTTEAIIGIGNKSGSFELTVYQINYYFSYLFR